MQAQDDESEEKGVVKNRRHDAMQAIPSCSGYHFILGKDEIQQMNQHSGLRMGWEEQHLR